MRRRTSGAWLCHDQVSVRFDAAVRAAVRPPAAFPPRPRLDFAAGAAVSSSPLFTFSDVIENHASRNAYNSNGIR